MRIKTMTTQSNFEPIANPFVVLIDSNEQQPFEFKGLRADANHGNRPLAIFTQWRCLGRHPNQLGDYSIDGFMGRVHVERKSIKDCQGTILGFGGARDRFEQELANLSQIEAALVVVEGSLAAVLAEENEHRTREHRVIAKQLLRSIIAFQQDYHVPWLFCDSRRMAEVVAFRFLERFYRKHTEHSRRVRSMLAKL
jgi:hypothetical protein